jgi:hypothetical protein
VVHIGIVLDVAKGGIGKSKVKNQNAKIQCKNAKKE